MARHIEEEVYDEILEIIQDIGSDIRCEQYQEAEKKIELLGKLLKVLKESDK